MGAEIGELVAEMVGVRYVMHVVVLMMAAVSEVEHRNLFRIVMVHEADSVQSAPPEVLDAVH